MTAANLQIGLGVDPMDRASPAGYSEAPVQDAPQVSQPKGEKPFNTKAWQAVAVNQRAASDFGAGTVYVTGQGGGVSVVSGRQPGRQSITIWVPTKLADGSTPNGVIIGPTEDAVQNTIGGVALNPGDSITIRTEARVYAGLLGGATTGACQYITEINPTGSLS